MGRPTLSIVQGYVGAGKTTFSKTLAAETGAVRLNADEWVLENVERSELDENWDVCFGRATEQLWHDAARLLRQRRDVILDFGFWSRASRDHARAEASALGANLVHYYVYAPDALLLERIQGRLGAVAQRNIENFQRMKARFDEPASDENAIRIENGKPAAAEAPRAG